MVWEQACTPEMASQAAYEMDTCPLVLIEWEDSVQPIPTWLPVAAYEHLEAIKCISVGWLICNTHEVKALAPNLADVTDPDDVQASGVIRIPTSAVRRITQLVETPGPICPCEPKVPSADVTQACQVVA